MIETTIFYCWLFVIWIIVLRIGYKQTNHTYDLYNKALQNVANKSRGKMTTTNSWRDLKKRSLKTLQGEFRGRAISVEHDSIHLNKPYQNRYKILMTVDMPASFSFTISPHVYWQRIYKQKRSPTYDDLFHINGVPKKRIERMFREDILLANKLIETVALFLGESKPYHYTLSGKVGQLVVEHQYMEYSADRLRAMLNGMAHLAEAIEAMDGGLVAITL